MSRTLKITIQAFILLAMFSFICIGYAALSDTMSVDGAASADPPDYDEIVITEIKRVSSTAKSEGSEVVTPTNVKSTFTAVSGNRVVYKITAHNFSDTLTYVYTGTSSSADYSAVATKLSVSAATESDGTGTLPNDVNKSYHSGTVIAPGEDFVFYATYDFKGSVTGGNILINFNFKPVIYSITYLDNNEVYAVDHITDNSVQYNVRTDHPENGSLVFANWVNANALPVTSFPKGNTNSYTLTAKWDKVYLIIFADADGTILYEEKFTDSSTKLSDEGQAIVDAKLAELNAAAAEKHLTVTWSEYDIANATGDIIVDAIYNYAGHLNLVPVFEEPDDGIVDYYRVEAVESLPEVVEVPGYVGDMPVKVINRITNVDGDQDWDNFEKNVKTIIIHEGVEVLEHNSLAWTPNLTSVKLPSTLTSLGKNTFSRNIALGGFGRGDDKKVLTIEFNGTKAEWKAILKNSDSNWDGGLKKGSVVKCSDGYFELTGTLSLNWSEKNY